MNAPAQLTTAQLSEISHRHPTWPWSLGLVMGCVVTCFTTGLVFAAGVRSDAKEQLAAETKHREEGVKAVMEQVNLLRIQAERNERKLDAILSRLDAQVSRGQRR